MGIAAYGRKGVLSCCSCQLQTAIHPGVMPNPLSRGLLPDVYVGAVLMSMLGLYVFSSSTSAVHMCTEHQNANSPSSFEAL